MRILYILHTTEMYGSTLSFFAMISGLKVLNIDFFVVCPHISNSFKQEAEKYNIQIFEVQLTPLILNKNLSRKSFFKSNWKKFIHSSHNLYNIVKIVQPNIIHTNTGVIHEGFWISKIMRIPHVWHIREYQDKDFNWHIMPTKKIFQNLLRQSYTITITDDLKKYLELNRNAKKIYNGVLYNKDISYCEIKEKYFIYASTLTKEKGVYDAIQCFHEFKNKHPEYKLLIFGIGTKETQDIILRIIQDQGLNEFVILKGYQPRDVILEHMRHAKALLVPSHFEGFGRMTAEAIMLGCPVIGRATGGTKEIIEETDGLLFHNTAEFTQQMNSIAEMSEQDYKKIITNASTKASDMFSIETSGKLIYDYYQEILNE